MTDRDDSTIEPPKKTSSERDDRMMAMFCHLGGLFGTFLVPLIIWLMKREESSFIDHHGKEALNFQITMMIGHVIGGALICVTFGLVNTAVWVLTLVFCIIAGMAANRGERYTYPMSIRFIS